jgi:cytochrome c biogenesis protein CcdA/thiol-disulfide isomerase/thioredoxin
VLVLLGIGFLAGVVTAISPCVLPVLPIILAGSATSAEHRRPYAIVAGLVVSFTAFTLAAAWLLDRLGLPKDLLRNIALVLLFAVAASLLVPRLAFVLERPFRRFSRVRVADTRGGFVLGVSLGLVFVPCAGPVLTVITVQAASMHVGLRTVLLTVAYSLGAAVPLLAYAIGGRRIGDRLRAHAQALRLGSGVLIAAGAIAIVFNSATKLQVALGDYTGFLQSKVEKTADAQRRLRDVSGVSAGRLSAAAASPSPLGDYGPAPDFRGISHWLNTPGERPLEMRQLRGKVVLVDFWTYSCINCIRTFPHLRAWDRAYRSKGLVIVGVHTPEFAFEHVLGNVRDAVRRFSLRYPVALDNDYATWNAYANQYWPADYLIDRRGHVRHAHFGEGEYTQTEGLIRRLLGERPGTRLSAAVPKPDQTPHELVTPESYLGYARLDPSRYRGIRIRPNVPRAYAFPRVLPQNALSYAGVWKIGDQRALAVAGARLRLHFHARNVYLVLGGHGSVQTFLDRKAAGSVRVDADRLYTLVSRRRLRDAVLELRFSPGVNAYAFTFG